MKSALARLGRQVKSSALILLILANPLSAAEPREPFVIPLEAGKSAEAATATEAQTVYGEPPIHGAATASACSSRVCPAIAGSRRFMRGS
ncbi:MAG: hypothetical protein ACREQ8_03495 [Woeseiaceae bacterium]